jgi:hypothetical protein
MRFFWIIVGAIAFAYLVRGTLKRFLMPKGRGQMEQPRRSKRNDDGDRDGTAARPKGFIEQGDIRDAKYRDL